MLVLCACTSHAAPSASRSSETPTPDRSVTAPPIAQAGLAACPASVPFARLPLFARDLGAPDDLLARPDGTVWVSDPVHGTLKHLSAGGGTLLTIADPETPEGIAILPDGRLAVAEQRLNRVVAIRPPSTVRMPLFELPSAGTAAGVDGIAFDPANGELLVPDSPHGTLVAWPASGGAARTIARGLGRGVDAAAGPQGRIYVTAEAGRWLLRIENGTGVPIGTFAQADDVVTKSGLLYVTLIAAGQVVAVDPTTGGGRTLVSGISAAQGLAVLRDGRLAIADSNRGVIAIAPACS